MHPALHLPPRPWQRPQRTRAAACTAGRWRQWQRWLGRHGTRVFCLLRPKGLLLPACWQGADCQAGSQGGSHAPSEAALGASSLAQPLSPHPHPAAAAAPVLPPWRLPLLLPAARHSLAGRRWQPRAHRSCPAPKAGSDRHGGPLPQCKHKYQARLDQVRTNSTDTAHIPADCHSTLCAKGGCFLCTIPSAPPARHQPPTTHQGTLPSPHPSTLPLARALASAGREAPAQPPCPPLMPCAPRSPPPPAQPPSTGRDSGWQRGSGSACPLPASVPRPARWHSLRHGWGGSVNWMGHRWCLGPLRRRRVPPFTPVHTLAVPLFHTTYQPPPQPRTVPG